MTVNLDKGQKISLSKSGGGELSVVRMGLAGRPPPARASSPS